MLCSVEYWCTTRATTLKALDALGALCLSELFGWLLFGFWGRYNKRLHRFMLELVGRSMQCNGTQQHKCHDGFSALDDDLSWHKIRGALIGTLLGCLRFGCSIFKWAVSWAESSWCNIILWSGWQFTRPPIDLGIGKLFEANLAWDPWV